jgi:hypothetical protein
MHAVVTVHPLFFPVVPKSLSKDFLRSLSDRSNLKPRLSLTPRSKPSSKQALGNHGPQGREHQLGVQMPQLFLTDARLSGPTLGLSHSYRRFFVFHKMFIDGDSTRHLCRFS